MTNAIDNTQDIIDVRDIIERYEGLEDVITASKIVEAVDANELAEALTLVALLDNLKGRGGDEQWRGDWYPVTLIHDAYFTDYIKELIHDCYEMPKETDSGAWPYRHMKMDYKAAAEEAKCDYSTINIGDATFFYR